MALPSTVGGARVLAISVSLCFSPVLVVVVVHVLLLLILALGCFVVVVFLILNTLAMLMFGRQYGALR